MKWFKVTYRLVGLPVGSTQLQQFKFREGVHVAEVIRVQIASEKDTVYS